MRVLCLSFLVTILILTSQAYAAPAEQPEIEEYGGTINQNLNITMLLERKGNVLDGEYFYEAQPASLSLKGEMTGGQAFILKEYDGDKNTGIFTGTFLADGRIEGQWSSPDGTTRYDFSLGKKAPSPWAGKWSRTSSYFTSATLKIWNVDEKGFDFRLSAQSGGNTGRIGGYEGGFRRAIFTGETSAFFENESGVLVFRQQGDELILSQEGSLHAGAGVLFAGEYRKGDIVLAPPTLVEHGILLSSAEEEVFKALVGDDYKGFLISLHIVHEDTDLDKIGATVYSGGVRGLFTIREAIIMTKPGGEIWAAITDGYNVRYYTNSKRFDGLPKTIDNWRSRFKHREVIMTYKPIVQ